MFEICETNPFDNLSKTMDDNEGNDLSHWTITHSLLSLSRLVLCFDSDDDFELV